MGWYGIVLLLVLAYAACRRAPVVAWTVLVPHIALGAAMGPSPWGYDACSRVLLPVYAILLALAIPGPAGASSPAVRSLSSD